MKISVGSLVWVRCYWDVRYMMEVTGQGPAHKDPPDYNKRHTADPALIISTGCNDKRPEHYSTRLWYVVLFSTGQIGASHNEFLDVL